MIRRAQIEDLQGMSRVGLYVKANVLSNPCLVTYVDYEDRLTKHGAGWVAVINGKIVGFAIVTAEAHNVWALFVDPEYERNGIGRALHDTMLNWYFGHTNATIWLSSKPAHPCCSGGCEGHPELSV
jgi:GNAT superfamily N-acetyltransferase